MTRAVLAACLAMLCGCSTSPAVEELRQAPPLAGDTVGDAPSHRPLAPGRTAEGAGSPCTGDSHAVVPPCKKSDAQEESPWAAPRYAPNPLWVDG